MIMNRKIKCCQAIKNQYPDVCTENCYEAIANGKGSETEMHGFVVDNTYFIDSKTLKIFKKDYFILVENIEDSLSD